jgi:hypothetical protein
MSDKTSDPRVIPTQESSAGAPWNQPLERPSDEELDRRDRDKSRPRRAAGPPLRDEREEASRDAPAHEPPPATDPMADPGVPAGAGPGAETRSAATQASDAGLPADHAGPKPSHDELDRRDRLKSGPRRAAGPPLRDEGPRAAEDAAQAPPPAPTDPRE